MFFSTKQREIRALVDIATSEMLIQSDWEKNFQLVQKILDQASTAEGFFSLVSKSFNEFLSLPKKVAVDQIMSRLEHNEQDVVYLALVLLETLMQNCASVIFVVNQPKIQAVLVRVATRARTSFKAKNKVLDLMRVCSIQISIFLQTLKQIDHFYELFNMVDVGTRSS